VGVLFIMGFAGILSTVLVKPITDDPNYLIKVSENENQVLIAALSELIMAFAVAGIAIWLYPVLKKYNEPLALGSVGFRIIEAVFIIVFASGLPLLLVLSQEYVKAGAPDASYFQTLGTLLLSMRNLMIQTLVSIAFSLGALMYYYIFYQSKLIPRWLSGWGFMGVALWLAAALLSMFGQIIPFSTVMILLAIPIAVNEMVLAIWLIVKGFNPYAIAAESVHEELI
jgi:hypothetical protein